MKERHWTELLQEYEANHAIHGEIDADHEVQRKLRQIFEERREKAAQRDPSLRVIPRFLPRKIRTGEEDRTLASLSSSSPSISSKEKELAQGQRLVRKVARNRFLQRKNREIMEDEQLEVMLGILQKHESPPFATVRGSGREEQSGRINYDDFCSAGEELGEEWSQFFTADRFVRFRRDSWGRISTSLFFHYVCRHMSLYQTRVQLSLYDTQGDGFLREQDLENYIYELIPSLEALSDLQENFYPFYVFTAVRKFFFFLDPKHTCRISIKELVTSPILHELLHLQTQGPTGGLDADELNWFSSHNTLRVYSQYLELDIDHNGMLSRSEIAGYGTGSLTTAIIDRVFEECLTYDGEMDYKTFLDFALAMETKKSPQSLAYFFRLLDIHKNGWLDRFTINYFFREIAQRLKELDGGINGEIVKVDDVTDEIFDMCKPVDPARITLDDLIRCGVGDTIVTMLTDLSGFWAYDNREHLIAEEAREEREYQ